MTTNEPITTSHLHNQLMATTTAGQGEIQRRRLPRLTPPYPTGGSSDETPRTAREEGSARERRRAQQQLARQQTPDGRETLSSPVADKASLPPQSNHIDERQITKRRKARRRVKSSSQITQEPSLLQGFENEIVMETSSKANGLMLPDLLLSSTHAGGAGSKSTPSSRIYIEDKKAISSVNKDAAASRAGKFPGQSPFASGYENNYTFQQQTAEVLKRYTVHVAKQTHAAFQKFFLFIHGINSGFALWICIFAFVFSQVDFIQFFNVYKSIALIIHLLFYLFLALCMTDILDRIDPVKFNRTVLLQSITAQNSGVAFLFYAVAMVVNLVMMQTEDQLRMIEFAGGDANTTALISTLVTSNGNTWRNLTVVRAVFIVVAWFIVSIHIKKDRLSTMIKNTEEKAFYEELKVEQNTVPLAAGLTPA